MKTNSFLINEKVKVKSFEILREELNIDKKDYKELCDKEPLTISAMDTYCDYVYISFKETLITLNGNCIYSIRDTINTQRKPLLQVPLQYVDYPKNQPQLEEWNEYTTFLKNFYLTHDKTTPAPIHKGKYGYYSLYKPLSNEAMAELNKQRGWDYTEPKRKITRIEEEDD